MRLIFIGAPGAGKGTQADILSQKCSIPKLSTGDILREEIKKGTHLGMLVKNIMAGGALVSDEVVIEVVRTKITDESCKGGFILDGFPRTVPQAMALEQIFENELPNAPTYVLNFEVSEDEIIRRISGRYSCSQCGAGYHKEFLKPKVEGVCDVCGSKEFAVRQDDNPESIKIRFLKYKENTEPLIEFYRNKNQLLTVNAMQSIEVITNDVMKLLKL
jgi:adenylate kinase